MEIKRSYKYQLDQTIFLLWGHKYFTHVLKPSCPKIRPKFVPKFDCAKRSRTGSDERATEGYPWVFKDV